MKELLQIMIIEIMIIMLINFKINLHKFRTKIKL